MWNLDDGPRQRSSKLTLVLEGSEGGGLLGLLGGGEGGGAGNKGGKDSELHLGKNSIRKLTVMGGAKVVLASGIRHPSLRDLYFNCNLRSQDLDRKH